MKRALISVYDKENIVDFAKELIDLDWEIISTGGTFKLLKDEGIPVIPVEDVTQSPEILDGRVKTLHPKIHGGILYKREDENHIKTLEDLDISSIDMVVTNLYPFEKTVESTDVESEIIEMIDIGGPTMVRAAAKNYSDVIVVVDKNDYNEIIEKLKSDTVDKEYRRYLSTKAFETTSNYDTAIHKYMCGNNLALNFKNGKVLRYGENPHQSAQYFKYSQMDSRYTANIKQLHGKELSYNNYNDMYAAIKGVKRFDIPACVAIKHANPCGIGTGKDSLEAYQKAYKCDTESIFGGIIAFNKEVKEDAAIEMSKIFLEVIVAPSFSDKAIEILSEKKNIRLIAIENLDLYTIPEMEFRSTINGVLIQEYDYMETEEENFVYPTDIKPTEEQLKNLKFAWEAVKTVASNGVLLAKNGGTVGIGQGQTKRSWAVENALERAVELDGAVMASDGFFFEDTVELLHEYGIKAVIQPGGSISDQKVIEACNKYEIALVLTGNRHFRH